LGGGGALDLEYFIVTFKYIPMLYWLLYLHVHLLEKIEENLNSLLSHL